MNRESRGADPGSLLRRRRELNCITCLKTLLDASPTANTRLHNVFYEPFLTFQDDEPNQVFRAHAQNLYRIFIKIQQARDMLLLCTIKKQENYK